MPKDILFTKDGKIGMVGMITEADRCIISSGFVALRIKESAILQGITPEYLFIVLSTKEIGRYGARRRTVIASTIPHIREERIKQIEIPILESSIISEITELVSKAFSQKKERKLLIKEVSENIDNYFTI